MSGVKKVIRVLMLVSLMVFAVTGCSEEFTQEGSGEGYVVFSETSGGTRGLSKEDTDNYSSEELVWAYVAIKKDGLHTVGQSEIAGTAQTGVTETVEGKHYVLRPAQECYGKGLKEAVGPFSWGEWKFYLYAYEKYESGKFTNEIYTGEMIESLVVISPADGGVVSVPVALKLSKGAQYTTKGVLVLGDIKLTVPSGRSFAAGGKIKVSMVVSGVGTIVSNEKTLARDYKAGEEVGLEFSTTRYEGVDEGAHSVNVSITYNGVVIAGARAFNFLVTSGVETRLYGNVSDLKAGYEGDGTSEEFGIANAVCKVGDTEYSTLEEAVVAVNSAGSGEIVLLRNIERGGSITINNANQKLTSGGYYIKGLTINVGKSLTISTGTGNLTVGGTSGECPEATVISFFIGKGTDFWIDTASGIVTTVENTSNVYHTGAIDRVIVKSACDVAGGKGYHINAEVREYLTYTRGYLEIGDGANIKQLRMQSSVDSTGSVLRGFATGRIENLSTYRSGSYINAAGSTVAMTDAHKQLFKKLTVYRGGMHFLDTGDTEASKTLYGIDGMYLDMPLARELLKGTPELFDKWVATPNGYWSAGVEDGGRVFMDGKMTKLYTSMKHKPIGGIIYYDAGDNGAVYTFYDAYGSRISMADFVRLYNTEVSRQSVLTNFVAYEVSGSPTKDRFYVYDNTNYFAKRDLTWGAQTQTSGTAYFLSGGGTSDTAVGNVGVGCGKTRTRAALNPVTNSSYTLYGLAGGKLGSGTCTTFTVYSRYEAATYSVSAISGNITANRKTMWSYIDYLNNGDNVADRYEGCGFEDYTMYPGGCRDWYIGSVGEIGELCVWCGAATLNSSSTSYWNGRYTLNTATTCPYSYNPERLKMWNLLSSKSSSPHYCFVCNEQSAPNGGAWCAPGAIAFGGGYKYNTSDTLAIRSF